MERTAELLTSLAGEHTVVVVEHDMDFVRSIARKVTVLHQGSVLAEGHGRSAERPARGGSLFGEWPIGHEGRRAEGRSRRKPKKGSWHRNL